MARSTPAHAGKTDVRVERIQQWIVALERMVEALRLLDESHAPPDVGARLDLAIERLKEEIAAAKAAAENL
ncbi:MAG: hypothetical protein ACJ8FI_00610 [Sphingomicrobium sp.]